MIDTDKYEGHTEGPWVWSSLNDEELIMFDVDWSMPYIILRAKEDDVDAQLIADAPKLLAEVKRLRKKIQLLHDTWFADAEMAGDVDERMNELLKYDGDEKFTKPLMPRREFLLTVEEMIE